MLQILPALKQFSLSEPIAVELLSKAYFNNKLRHAYIFTGKSQEKVNNFIKAFAKILLCSTKTAEDNCLNCKIFDTGQHPDFRIWAPDNDKSKFIVLPQVHELVNATQTHPITSKHKVLVLDQIQNLRVEGSNALLKTLEEPTHFTTIFLVADSLDSVLATIISRCQIIPLKAEEDTLNTENIEVEKYIPKSYLQASRFAEELSKLAKEDLKNFLIKFQNATWNKFKENSNADFVELNKLLENIEKYISGVDSYVNTKIISENFFIEVFETPVFK